MHVVDMRKFCDPNCDVTSIVHHMYEGCPDEQFIISVYARPLIKAKRILYLPFVLHLWEDSLPYPLTLSVVE